MDAIATALGEFGLGDKEIKVYLGLLGLGEATAKRISELTNINRTTLYDILNSLIRKGAAGFTIKEKVTYFYAARPQVLLRLVKEKERMLERALPALTSRMGVIGKRPKIEFYEGAKGIDDINQDVLGAAKEILAYGSFEITGKLAKYQSLDYRKRRIALRIPTRVVTDASIEKLDMLKQRAYAKLTKIYINSSLSHMPTWTYIYANKVAMLLFEKEQFFGFIIESPSIVAKEKQIFNMLRKQARELKM